MDNDIHHIILRIDSKKTVFSKTSKVNPIKISIGNPGGNSNIVRITIKSASIPNVFYNVTQYNNYFFIYTTLQGRQYITIPEGQYNMSQFISYINSTTAFTNANAVLTFDIIKNKLITTCNQNLIYEWVDNVLLKSPTAFKLLGLILNIDFVVPSVPTIHPHIADLSGIKNIYIDTSFAKMNSLNEDGNNNTAAIIPINVPFGGVIQYQNNEQTLDSINRSLIFSQNMTDPEFYLRDVDGNLIDMNGVDYQLHWKLYMTHNEHINIYD
jgi:hypothetical protein